MDTDNHVQLEKIKQQLDQTSFENLIEHLVQVEKWQSTQAQKACDQYRNFLFIKRKYGEQYDIPPSADIDEVWNTHILFTKQYTAFTTGIFGHYLNHHTAHSPSAVEARKILRENFINTTQSLYFKEFGTYLYCIRRYPVLTELKRIMHKYFFNRRSS